MASGSPSERMRAALAIVPDEDGSVDTELARARHALDMAPTDGLADHEDPNARSTAYANLVLSVGGQMRILVRIAEMQNEEDKRRSSATDERFDKLERQIEHLEEQLDECRHQMARVEALLQQILLGKQ